ncbi:MAG: hypothetical protein WD341_14250 [Tistlia sp.]
MVVPAHPLGAGRHHPARPLGAGRADGTHDPLGDPADGGAGLPDPPPPRGQPAQAADLPDRGGPASQGCPGAARRGGQPGRHRRAARRRDRDDAPRAAGDDPESRRRRGRGPRPGPARALDPLPRPPPRRRGGAVGEGAGLPHLFARPALLRHPRESGDPWGLAACGSLAGLGRGPTHYGSPLARTAVRDFF